MTNSKLYLAAAGSGKTTFILKQVFHTIEQGIMKDKYLIIVTYTTRNQENIKECVIKKYGYIPKSIVVVGWYKFLLDYFIRPFKGSVISLLYDRHIGIHYVEGQSGIIKTKNNKFFTKNKNEEKFLDKKNNIYSDKLCEFAYKCYEVNHDLLLERLFNIIDTLFIDEAQDLSGWDFDIINIILKSKFPIKCILCADPRQRTYETSAAIKNKKYSGKIKLYIDEKVNINCEIYINIDTTTLNFSHRCVQSICDFAFKISNEYPKANSCQCKQCCEERDKYPHKKGMFLLKNKDVPAYIKTYNPISLIWNKRFTVKTKIVYNYGESKGLEADSTLIYPTKNIIKFLCTGNSQFKPTTKNKLYVAVTRAKFAAAIVVDDEFNNNKISLPFWNNDE